MKKLFLIDGHAILYRSHYAFIARPLINSKGLNTSAISGFIRTLWDIINKEKPTHLAVAFDLSGPTFRHIIRNTKRIGMLSRKILLLLYL